MRNQQFVRERFAALLKQGNWKHTTIAKALSLARQTVKHVVVHGRLDTSARIGVFNRILEFLQITKEQFEGIPLAPIVPIQDAEWLRKNNMAVTVPIMGDVAAGPGAEAEGVLFVDDAERVEGTSTDIQARVIRVVGRSMEPRYYTGDLLFCKKVNPEIVLPCSEKPEVSYSTIKKYNGWPCVVVLDSKPMLKLVEVTRRAGENFRIRLVSINNEFDPIDVGLDEELRIQWYVYKLVRYER